MKYENLPWARGTTFYGSAVPPDATSNAQFEGKEWEIEDMDYSVSPPVARSNRYVRVRVVRNVSGILLLPKRLARFQAAGTDGRMYGAQVAGYTTITDARGFPIDEFLPAAGVQNNDLFYIVIRGPSKCITSLAGGANLVVSVGDYIQAATAATSQATTAGRVELNVVEASTAPGVFNVGHALSAATTANTNSDLLVEVGTW